MQRAPKKRGFLVENFQKVPKNAFFWPFIYKNLTAAQKFGQNWVFIAQKINLVDLKKGRQNFLLFSKVPPPPSRSS